MAITAHRTRDTEVKPAAHKAAATPNRAPHATPGGAASRQPSPQVAMSIIEASQHMTRLPAHGSERAQVAPPRPAAVVMPMAVAQAAMPAAPMGVGHGAPIVGTHAATATATATATPMPATHAAAVGSTKPMPAPAAAGHSTAATEASAAPTTASATAAAPPAPAGAATGKSVKPTAASDKSAKLDAADGEPAGPAAATAAGPAVKLHLPEAPAANSPKAAARLHGVQARAGGAASAHGRMPSGAQQTAAARDAVTEPDAEALARAQQALIAQVNAAPSPEIVKLCEHIRDVIRNKRPPDEDALMSAKPEGEALAAGSQLSSTVEGETGKVAANYGAMNQPAAGTPTQGAELPPQPGVAATPALNARAGVPDAVPAANVSLDKDVAENRKKAQDAGMDTPAAQLVQSGPVADARNAQGELEQAAKEDPAKVLAGQKEALGKAEGDMLALQAQALAALTASRTGTQAAVASAQGGMVGSEETQRTQAASEAKKAFDDARSQVEALLKPLAGNAMAEWEAAKDVLATQFKADLAPVQKRVDERHAGASGFIVGLWDAVTGLPDWAETAYTQAETHFGDGVIAKLTAISTEVNAVIATCDLLIKTARERIASIFASLPQSLAGWAAGERAKFDGQLDHLQDQVIAARDAFNKDLVERSSAAVDEVRAEVAELRKKAGGLVGRIASAINRFLDDPVKFIIEGLLELLGIPPAAFWAVVAKIKKVVKDIAADPMGFANNLLKGLAEGFGKFFDNFGTHLLKGFLGWLLGGLKDVQIPKDVSVKSIVTFFLQLMGITWPNIRKILVKKVGAKNVALVEKVYSLVSLLIEKGPEGIYEMIKEKLDPQSIVDQVVDMAVDYMVTAIAKQVAARILLLFNPAGAIAQALEAIYRVLKWIFQNAARIFALVETVVNGIADVLAGNTSGFAAAVEKALGMLIAPVISFIADYMSLGDLPATVASKVKSMREWILGMIESALTWVIEKGKALLAAVGIGGKKDEKKKKNGKFDGHVGKTVSWTAEHHGHKLWLEEAGSGMSVRMASVETDVATQLNEYETKAKELPEAKQKEVSGKISTSRGILAQLETEASDVRKEAMVAEPPTDLAEKDDKVESTEQALASSIREVQQALGTLPPDEVKQRAHDEVAKLPASVFGVSELRSELTSIFDKLAPLGLKRLYVRSAGNDFEILASASDPRVVRRLLALHGDSHFGCCFLIARVDGKPILPAGQDLVVWNEGNGGDHAEVRLDTFLRRALPRPTNYKGPPKRVEIVIRWSPCLGGCTPVLLRLQEDYRNVIGQWEIVYFGEYQTAEHPVEMARAAVQRLAGAGIAIREVTTVDQILAIDVGTKK